MTGIATAVAIGVPPWSTTAPIGGDDLADGLRHRHRPAAADGLGDGGGDVRPGYAGGTPPAAPSAGCRRAGATGLDHVAAAAVGGDHGGAAAVAAAAAGGCSAPTRRCGAICWRRHTQMHTKMPTKVMQKITEKIEPTTAPAPPSCAAWYSVT